ncbi:hypothetical protein [Emticicia sp. 21SJ11W-3]|uniref:hypothetical protein n=1 Tax=Emticicia sp. 21SJ11W-3 TaxID=2916755 RepID=UPI00209F9551|nr:hypothetical protein [Emticicia sp. 21SJ11W-3]UTA67283.1 hypothetical protein MB380_16970 [Emticicia sp. 21SJ11W-3]
MRNDMLKFIEAINSSKFLNTEEEYSIFWDSLENLKEASKEEISNPIEYVEKLFKILNNETEDFETLMEVVFFIFEFARNKNIDIDEFIKTIFIEFDEMKEDKIIWVEEIISLMIKKEYIDAIKFHLNNSDKKIIEAFKFISSGFINDLSLDKPTISYAKEIFSFIENLNSN